MLGERKIIHGKELEPKTGHGPLSLPAQQSAVKSLATELTAALPGPAASSKYKEYYLFDKVSFLTEMLDAPGAGSEVGTDCLRFLAVVKALDWSTLNSDAKKFLVDQGACKRKGNAKVGEDECPDVRKADLQRLRVVEVMQQVCVKLQTSDLSPTLGLAVSMALGTGD